MTGFIEISRPWNWKPWLYSGEIMVRFGWGPVAVGWLKISWKQYSETEWEHVP